jgi:two-component system nitrate/nitrite response regulator NarL
MALRCLLVDDNEAFLASASRLLGCQGLEIVGQATSGCSAMGLAERLRPDLVLVDVQLGEEDGLELARRLGTELPELRVVLISTHSGDDVADLIAGTPAAGFLPKSALNATAIAELLG